MSEQNNIKPIRLLLCAPAPELEGGIGAVVYGLEEGFRQIPSLRWKRIPYAKAKEGMNSWRRTLSEIGQLFGFVAALFQYHPDAILVESSFDKKTVLRDSIHLFIALLSKSPVILHAHGGEWHLISKWPWIWRSLAGYLLRRSAAIVVTSNAEEEIIRSIYHNSVNVAKIFNPLVIPNVAGKKIKANTVPIIVFASRLIESKGILDVIESMEFLRDLQWELRVFGSGILENDLKHRVVELALTERIIFCGQVKMGKLLEEYAECDIFLFPSYHLEGFPMALFFAVAMGAPIIATQVRPLPEYLSERENCLWVNPKDPKVLGEKIRILLLSENLRNTMKRNNILLAEQFNPVIVAKHFMSVFQAAAGGDRQ